MESPVILALDVATVTGFCHGAPGGELFSGAARPFPQGSPDGDAYIGFAKWLKDLVGVVSPTMIFVEKPLDPRRLGPATNAATFERLITMAGLVHMIAAGRGQIPVYRVDAVKVRRYFIGANPKRDEAKRLTIRKCETLGHIVQDDNAADAIALHYFAAGHLKAGRYVGEKVSPGATIPRPFEETAKTRRPRPRVRASGVLC